MSGSGKARRAATEKIKAQRAAEERRRRNRLFMLGGGAVAAVAAVVGITVALTTGGTPGATVPGNAVTPGAAAIGSPGPEGVPVPGGTVLAGPSTSTTGQTIDGISCQTSEQTLFHIHAHLTIFVDGQPKQVPAAIGIPGAQTTNTPQGSFVSSGTCFYWLHTHAADGIIHIESPVQRSFTLGNVFDIWGQPLSRNQVGPATGTVTAYLNGSLYSGDVRSLPLTAHAQIQLVVGSPNVAPVSGTFPNGL